MQGIIHAPLTIKEFYSLFLITILIIGFALFLLRKIYFKTMEISLYSRFEEPYLEAFIIFFSFRIIDLIESVKQRKNNSKQPLLSYVNIKMYLLVLIQSIEKLSRTYF